MPQLSQNGLVHILALVILTVGLIAGVYLVQHPQIFKGRAQAFNPCLDSSTPPNDEIRSIQVGGITRYFKVHYPANYDHTPTPLVLNFHGFGQNGLIQEEYTGMNATADQNKFIVVYPQATYFNIAGGGNSWNAGSCCNNAVDDVLYTESVIDNVTSNLCVNQRKVYATGLSLGASMTYRLACELSDKIAAIAPVSGARLVDCNLSRAVPTIHFHNLDDPVALYNGGYYSPLNGEPVLSIPDSLEPFESQAQCSPELQQIYQNGDSTCGSYEPCQSGSVQLCTVAAAAHTWPGATTSGDPGTGSYATPNLDANQKMWEFFSRFELPDSNPQYVIGPAPIPTCEVVINNGKNVVNIPSPAEVNFDWTSIWDLDGRLLADGNWGPGEVPANGSATVSPQSAGIFYYNLTCSDNSGNSEKATLIVNVGGQPLPTQAPSGCVPVIQKQCPGSLECVPFFQSCDETPQPTSTPDATPNLIRRHK